MITIIPAIDIIEGKCVRLTQGDFNQKQCYDTDPVDMALRFEDAGLEKLHLVDLDGARLGEVVNYKVLEKIVRRTGLKVEFSGGLTTDKHVEIAFECGARQISVGSVAVTDDAKFLTWLKQYGPEAVILSVDVKGDEVVIKGWKEEGKITFAELLKKYVESSIKYVTSTEVSRDGTFSGPAIEHYKKIRELHPHVALIASGGIASLKDVEDLNGLGLYGVIIGKALFEGRIALADLKVFRC